MSSGGQMNDAGVTSLSVVRARGLLALAIAALGVAMFHFWGNTYAGLDTREATRSCFVWLGRRWRDSAASFGGGDYSHAWLIPLITGWLIWRQRSALRAAPVDPSLAGLAVTAFGLFLHWAGARAQQPQASAVAMVVLCWGIPFYVRGWPTARLLLFPCAYLLFCIPWNFFDSATFPLRLLASMVSAGLLNGIGIPSIRSGTAIYSADGGGFNFDVADPCSGIRSLLAMMALTALYAYFRPGSILKRWVLFVGSLPLAMAGNIARIVAVAVVARMFGPEAAQGAYHDYSGYIFYTVAVLLMVGLGRLLEVDLRGWAHRHRERHLRRKGAAP